MRNTERVIVYSALAGIAAMSFLRGAERNASAVPEPTPSDLGPADAVILTGKDTNLTLRKDEDFRKRYTELETKYKDVDPKAPGFEGGRQEVEGFFKEVEAWRKEIGEKLGKLQAEQIEKAYREMTAATDVVADRNKVDIVLRFVPTSQPFTSNSPADAMLQVQVRTFLHYPETIDLTPELIKELSLKDE